MDEQRKRPKKKSWASKHWKDRSDSDVYTKRRPHHLDSKKKTRDRNKIKPYEIDDSM